jgi:anti-anti-sigma factor
MNDFAATTRMEGATAVLDLSGLLDRGAEPVLTEVFGKALEDGDGPIALNFSRVEYINSTGIALVVGVLAKARAADRSVTAFGLTDHYREIFTITRLSDFMGIHDDESAATAH